VEVDGHKKLYFVVETKGSDWLDNLRQVESDKIKCGQKHFEEIAMVSNPAKYIKSKDVDGMMRHV